MTFEVLPRRLCTSLESPLSDDASFEVLDFDFLDLFLCLASSSSLVSLPSKACFPFFFPFFFRLDMSSSASESLLELLRVRFRFDFFLDSSEDESSSSLLFDFLLRFRLLVPPSSLERFLFFFEGRTSESSSDRLPPMCASHVDVPKEGS